MASCPSRAPDTRSNPARKSASSSPSRKKRPAQAIAAAKENFSRHPAAGWTQPEPAHHLSLGSKLGAIGA